MTIKLGNYNESKRLYYVKQKVAHQSKIDIIKGLVDSLVQLANDICDTFWHLHKNDREFTDKLWDLLCRNKVNGIEINSHLACGAKTSSHAYLSKYGVAIYNQSLKDDLMLYLYCLKI